LQSSRNDCNLLESRLQKPKKGGAMSEHKPGDEEHQHESPLLHAQEHKGYGDDEGEREELLEDAEEEEPETASD
jgi:hypothetical protein